MATSKQINGRWFTALGREAVEGDEVTLTVGHPITNLWPTTYKLGGSVHVDGEDWFADDEMLVSLPGYPGEFISRQSVKLLQDTLPLRGGGWRKFDLLDVLVQIRSGFDRAESRAERNFGC